MKLLVLISFLMTSISASAYWRSECRNDDMFIIVEVESTSFESGDSAYDNAPVKQAKGKVIIFKDGERFEYKNNLFIEDEGNGNYDMQGFAIDGGHFTEVLSIYFEHEGGYINGYIKKPTFKVQNGELYKTGYTDWASFDDFYCDNDF